MVETKQKPKRMWQNLLYLKCPNCNCRLESSGKYLACPTPSEENPQKSCFFIKKERVAEVLLDTNHPANYCLTEDERARINEMIETELQTGPDTYIN